MWIIMGIIIFIVILSILKYITEAKKIKELKAEPTVVLNLEKIECFFQEVSAIKQTYITKNIELKLIRDYKEAYELFKQQQYTKLKNERIYVFNNYFSNLSTLVKDWNNQFVESELVKHKVLFDNIDGKSLDYQQRRAVVVDEQNNLVLAGAGSGKTLTISGKVKYLVETKNINPSEILLISFTRKAAEEMRNRIANKLHIGVDVKTFHGLGLDIIKHTYPVKYIIAEDEYLSRLVESYFKRSSHNDKIQMQNIINFFSYYINVPKDWEQFDCLGDCYDYYKHADFETLKGKVSNIKEEIEYVASDQKVRKITLQGETVKSLEEVMIANFLYLNGINYNYEKGYPYDIGVNQGKMYQPDFYLPDYDIYIEHFGITKDYRAPWLTQIEAKKYIDGIRWKREQHKNNKTKLLETYSYFNKEGILLTELERLLKSEGVMFVEADYTLVYKQVFEKTDNKYFKEFIKLVSTFIKLFKSNGFDETSFANLFTKANMQANSFLIERSRIFLSIVQPIYVEYQQNLQTDGQIDFDDMINLASESIRQGRQNLDYKYIIIDEYQDISISRFNLIKEIKDKTKAKLLCVGDDWQSIYRFAGSDITLFTDFGKYLGYYELLKIEKTYRNSQELINIAAKFIMQNKNQLPKNLVSDKHYSNPLRIIGYKKDVTISFAKVIAEIVDNFGEEAEITILGRNRFDKDVLKEHEDFSVNEEKIMYVKYPKLKLRYLTTHKAKGLEADNVIVLNLENKLLGFPNKISDDPVLSMVLTSQDNYAFAEERRLFYVAITRTKNTTYLLTPEESKSVFVSELIKNFKINYEFMTEEDTVHDNPSCPRCLTGKLVIRENSTSHKLFLGCSNYPKCNMNLNDLEIINNQIKCQACGGYMSKRRGPYGEFYGCTNYPLCKNTLQLHKYK